jgi:fumarate hydratase subunit beta
MTHISLPASGADIAQLKLGETVYLSGIMLTARDAAHKYLVETFVKGTPPASELALYEKLKADLSGGAIYHCGPVVSQQEGRYAFVSAGPTTSIREEVYEDLVIAHFGVKVIIGKGGMAARTLKACQEHQAAYLHAIGGAGTLIAASVEEVVGVYKLAEFGAPEAFWKIRVKDFPTVVTMDSHGNSLHTTVAEQSKARLQQLLAVK